jgi:hypothetical protein
VSKPSPSLGAITKVTFTAPRLDAVAAAYGGFLDYRLVADGKLTAAQAEAWDAPALAGRPWIELAPAAADDFRFRVIQADIGDYVPFASYGWNAAELIVRDVDSLAERLAESPFEVIGEPQDLSFSEDIRAMQVLGPGRELLYLTQFKKPVPGLEVPEPRCDVDKTFIVILGGPSMDGLQAFYADGFGVPRPAVVASRVKGMSAAFGLSPEHRYPIAALPVGGRCLIELDEMPAAANPRPTPPGGLPPGIAIVSFAGATSRCLRGPAGELLELIAAD